MQISFVPSSLKEAWQIPSDSVTQESAPESGHRPDVLIVDAGQAKDIREPRAAGKRVIVDAVDHGVDPQQIRNWFRMGFSDVVLDTGERIIQSPVPLPSPFYGMIGRTDGMVRLFSQIQNVSPTMATVLIRGESGTGKELVARAIHLCSSRKQGPFVPVNCAAIPDTLLEDDLFGHVRGAFTDAHMDRTGKIESANGGTLFLDEIGDMPPALQVKLLRVLQERVIQPLGTSSSRTVDVRVVAATAADLELRMKEGRFREDLYYRLNVVPLFLPPLRDRRADIPLLIEHFAHRLAERHDLPIPRFSDDGIQTLQNRDWNGNIRELEHVLERIMVLSGEEDMITSDMIPSSPHTTEKRS